jgi:hypothetical protein
MRHFSRRKRRIARLHPELLVSNLPGELALDDIKPFVQIVVHMSRRTTFTHVAVLKYIKRSARVLGR